MKYDFFTYFDSNYIFQGLALYSSLKNTGIKFRLFAIALDEAAFEMLVELKDSVPEIIAVKLADIESFDAEFSNCRNNRSQIEYYFTLSPVAPLYLFEQFPDIEILNYLDSDLYFYSSPAAIYEELKDKSILIIEHRFPRHLKYMERNGKFNVAFQLYRNNNSARQCLLQWRKQCIAWCYDKVEAKRYADQKYLDTWSRDFDVSVCQNKGANLAPWNWMQYNLEITDGKLIVDENELIFFHFQGFRFLSSTRVCHNLGCYFAVMPREIRYFLYQNYAEQFSKIDKLLNENCKKLNPGIRFVNHRTNWMTYIKNIIGMPFNTMKLNNE
ncbi:MAG: hypothetical protein KOO69_08480 [Victivallales bacterium]|nr:hypothetical protein [Victivallales bacterium]